MIEPILYIVVIPVMMFMIVGILLNSTTIRNVNMTTYPHYYIAECGEGVYDVWMVEDEDDFLHTHVSAFYNRDEALDEVQALETHTETIRKAYTL